MNQILAKSQKKELFGGVFCLQWELFWEIPLSVLDSQESLTSCQILGKSSKAVFCKKGGLKNLATFTGKTPVLASVLLKVQAWGLPNFSEHQFLEST